MTKSYIHTGIILALLCATTAGAQTASPQAASPQAMPPGAAKIMTPPPKPDEIVITVFAKKKYKSDRPPGLGLESIDPCTIAIFEYARICIAQHDHSLKDADLAYASGDFPKALAMYKYSYEKMGYDKAGLMVARMYFYGQGTARDTNEAIVWLKRMATNPRPLPQDDAPVRNFKAYPPGAEAAMTLARIYQYGWEVPVDAKQARRWYARADALGYYPATQIMGDIYRTGYAGEKSLTKAMIYYKRAGRAGYGPAQYLLAQIYYLGQDGVRADRAQGLAWLQASADSGYPDGLYAVGRFYETGEGGFTADPAKALIYYKEAAVKGQPDAAEAIGRAFYTGNGLPRDLVTARRWFEKAAEGASVDAAFNLAVMLINGEGGDRDLVKAWVWLKIADAGGHPNARAALAELEPRMTADEKAKAQALFAPAA